MPATPLLSSRRRRALAALAFALAGPVAGCGPKDTEFPPVCPGLALVPDGADLVRFNGQGHDVVNLLTRARITAVPAKCETDSPGIMKATLHVVVDVGRGPAATGPQPPLDYFVAVMEGERVRQEHDFTLSPAFAPNVDRTTVAGDDIELLLPIGKKKSAAAYQIYVGFRLTPDELAYNRTHRMP